jgi:hypothetical protein
VLRYENGVDCKKSAKLENPEEISALLKEKKAENIEIQLVPEKGGNHGTRIAEL